MPSGNLDARMKHGLTLSELHMMHVNATERVAEESDAGLSEEEILQKWTRVCIQRFLTL